MSEISAHAWSSLLVPKDKKHLQCFEVRKPFFLLFRPLWFVNIFYAYCIGNLLPGSSHHRTQVDGTSSDCLIHCPDSRIAQAQNLPKEKSLGIKYLLSSPKLFVLRLYIFDDYPIGLNQIQQLSLQKPSSSLHSSVCYRFVLSLWSTSGFFDSSSYSEPEWLIFPGMQHVYFDVDKELDSQTNALRSWGHCWFPGGCEQVALKPHLQSVQLPVLKSFPVLFVGSPHLSFCFL